MVSVATRKGQSVTTYAIAFFGLAFVLALPVLAALRSPLAADRGASLFPKVMELAVAASIAYFAWTLPPFATLTAGAVLSPVSGNWSLLGFPSGLSPDRLLLVAGVAVVLLRGPGARTVGRLRFRPTHAVLALVLIYTAASALAAGTLLQRAGFFRLFDAFGILPFLVFLVAAAVFRTERSRATLLVGFVGLGAYLGLTALFEAAKVDSLVFPRFIVSSTADDTSGRAYGVFLEPVSNGAGLFVCGVAAAIALVTWRRFSARIFAGLTAAVCAAGALFTLERSVWIGAAAAIVVTAVVALPYLGGHAPRIAAAVALASAAAVLAAGAFVAVPGLSQKLHHRATDQATVWDRQNLATAAVNMIQARPLFGFGWSTFEQASPEYFRQSPNYPLDPNLSFNAGNNGTFSVHNEFLDYGATLGLVGTTLWLLGLVLAVGGALRARGAPDLMRWRYALLPLLVFYLVIENAVPPALFPNLALWLWLGVVWSGYGKEPSGTTELDHREPALARRHDLPMPD